MVAWLVWNDQKESVTLSMPKIHKKEQVKRAKGFQKMYTPTLHFEFYHKKWRKWILHLSAQFFDMMEKSFPSSKILFVDIFDKSFEICYFFLEKELCKYWQQANKNLNNSCHFSVRFCCCFSQLFAQYKQIQCISNSRFMIKYSHYPHPLTHFNNVCWN